MNMLRAILVAAICIACSSALLAQRGGKAEPNRVEFAAGKSTKILSGTLGHDQEMEYVFTARKGQQVTIRNPNTSLFDVRVFNDEAGVETEFDSSRTFTVDLPSDGDYMLFVRKKRVARPNRARFSITLAIK